MLKAKSMQQTGGQRAATYSKEYRREDQEEAPPLQDWECEIIQKSIHYHRTPIEVGFTINAITHVDPVAQTFKADVKLFARWRDVAMADDKDMVALRERDTFHCGVPAPKTKYGFHALVIKEIEPRLIVRKRDSNSRLPVSLPLFSCSL